MSRRRGNKEEEDDDVPQVAVVSDPTAVQTVQAANYTEGAVPLPEEAAAAPTSSSYNLEAAEKVFSMDFDNLKYEDLCKILAGCTKAQMDEVMSRREQEMQAKIHEEKAARREAFYDNADGYFYSQMLTDIYENLQKRTTAGGQRNKIITPILEKVGKKKTIITNFGKICENFNRSVEDVKSFIESEVSTTSNLNGENALLLKYETRKSTDFDAVIIKYLDKWVKCNACKSTNTVLHKEDRRFEIVCNVCQATRTVTKEGKGTAANIEKRSKRNHTTL